MLILCACLQAADQKVGLIPHKGMKLGQKFEGLQANVLVLRNAEILCSSTKKSLNFSERRKKQVKFCQF